MPAAPYRIEVDWENDGSFDHPDADVYPDVHGRIRARRGRNYDADLSGRATAGHMSFVLNNDDHKYDRLNTQSPLYGLVLPGRAVRLRMAQDPPFERMLLINVGSPDELWLLDQANPSGSTRIGDLPSGLTNPRGLAYHNGEFLALDDTGDELWLVDPQTPDASTRIGALPAGLTNPRGLTSHNKELLATDNADDDLWLLDRDDPDASTRIGALPSGLANPLGLASHNGELLAVDNDGDELWLLNRTAPASSTRIGALPAGLTTPRGLASYGGDLFAVDGGGAELWLLNRETPGDSRLVGAFPSAVTFPYGIAGKPDPSDFDPSDFDPADFNVQSLPYATIWGGFLDAPERSTERGGGARSRFSARGLFSTMTQETVRTTVRISISTGAAVAALFEASGLPAARRGAIPTGGTTLAHWWGDGLFMDELRSLEEAEGGFALEDADGALGFETRLQRVGAAQDPAAVFATVTPGRGQIGALKQEHDDRIETVVNHAEVPYRTYATGPQAILWSLDSPVRIAAGATVDLYATYPGTTAPRDHVAVASWSAIANTDRAAYANPDGTGADRSADLSITTTDTATERQVSVTNTGSSDAYLTLLRVRGSPLVAAGDQRHVAEDSASITKYQRKGLTLEAPWLSSLLLARSLAEWIILLRKEPRQTFTVRAQMNDFLDVARTLDLSAFVELLDEDGARGMFVESIEHTIERGERHDMTVVLTPSAVLGNFMVLGAGRLNTGILG